MLVSGAGGALTQGSNIAISQVGEPVKSNASLTLYARLLTYVKPYWKAFAIALIGNAIYAGSSTLMARIMGF